MLRALAAAVVIVQAATQQPPRPTAPAPAAQPQGEAVPPFDRDTLTGEYRIGPGDVLQLFVWREAELTRELRVRSDGYVSVPLLGDLSAVAKTPKGLAAEVTQALSKYVNGPVVTVTLVNSSALRFFVVGQVMKAGEFPLVGRTTVMQALALAGGFRDYAKTEDIKLLRQELSGGGSGPRTREIILPVNYKAISQGQNLQQNVALKPGDVIVVP